MQIIWTFFYSVENAIQFFVSIVKSSRKVKDESCLCLWEFLWFCLPASNSVSKTLLSSTTSLCFSFFCCSECAGPDHGAAPGKRKEWEDYVVMPFSKNESEFFLYIYIFVTRCQCMSEMFSTMILEVTWTVQISAWYWWVDR